MAYEAKKFEQLIGLEGFSERALRNHFTLYEGYVANTNKVWELLGKLGAEDKMATPEYAELKRRMGWEFNGMRLHEIYFAGLTKKVAKIDENSALAKKMSQDFGTVENWEASFRATGAMRGIGWVVLYYDPIGKTLFNTWINEHDAGHFAGCAPILVMDVFEHAYMIDYDTKRVGYIDAYVKAIDWQAAEARFEAAK